MKIDITKATAEAIQKIQNRYFFGLFEQIRVSEDEEYQFRNAIEAIAKSINTNKIK